MQYMRAYKYVFEHPKWATNLLLGGVCAMIPVIGPIVLIGWLYEVIEAIHRRGEKQYPDFDFGKFVPYMSRGVWPFLVSLALSVLILPIVFIFVGVMMYVMARAGGRPNMGLIFALQAGYMAALMIFSFFLSLISTPIMLRAGLMQEFKAAFSPRFVWDFVKKMWRETLLVTLFLMVSGIVVGIGGFILCCVGVLPAQVLASLAQAHLHEQLYTRYLERGGMAIPLKEEPPSSPPTEDVPPLQPA